MVTRQTLVDLGRRCGRYVETASLKAACTTIHGNDKTLAMIQAAAKSCGGSAV